MNILAELGLDQADVVWEDLAACRNVYDSPFDGKPLFDPWFDAYEEDSEPYNVRKSADEMCLSCPVQRICYETGKSGAESGVRGGVYLVNGRMDKTRNSHKTPEVWRRIREAIGKL